LSGFDLLLERDLLPVALLMIRRRYIQRLFIRFLDNCITITEKCLAETMQRIDKNRIKIQGALFWRCLKYLNWKRFVL
jgi:hypothetical protein